MEGENARQAEEKYICNCAILSTILGTWKIVFSRIMYGNAAL